MKKILTLLTGIVFLVAILVTCNGRNAAGNDGDSKDSKTVTIYLKVLDLDGEMHLLMRDSNDTTYQVVDNLITEVNRGDIVKWKKDNPGSGILTINQIRPTKKKGLFLERAELVNDIHQIEIPDNAEPGIAKYVIVFTHTNGDIWFIDPYLKIPRPE